MSYQPPRTDESRNTIFIRGLRSDVEADEVCEIFARDIGKCRIEMANLAHNRDFLLIAIRFDSHEAAQEAIDKFDGREICGSKVSVAWYRNFRKPKALYTRRNRRGGSGSREHSYERERDPDAPETFGDQQVDRGGGGGNFDQQNDFDESRGLASAVTSQRNYAISRRVMSPPEHDSRRSRTPSPSYAYAQRGPSRSPSYPGGRYSPPPARDTFGQRSPARVGTRTFNRGWSRSRSRSPSPRTTIDNDRSRGGQPLRKRPRNAVRSPPRDGTPPRDDRRPPRGPPNGSPPRRDAPHAARSTTSVARSRVGQRERVRDKERDRDRRNSVSPQRSLAPSVDDSSLPANTRNGGSTTSVSNQRTAASVQPKQCLSPVGKTSNDTDVHLRTQPTLDGSGSVRLTEADLNTQLTMENVDKLNRKKVEMETRLRADCETFATVVRMLISKDAHLSGLIEFALRECLRDLSSRCVDELRNYAVELIASQNMIAASQAQLQRSSTVQSSASTPSAGSKVYANQRPDYATTDSQVKYEMPVGSANIAANPCVYADDNLCVSVAGSATLAQFETRRVVRTTPSATAAAPAEQLQVRTTLSSRIAATLGRDGASKSDNIALTYTSSNPTYDLAVDEDMNI